MYQYSMWTGTYNFNDVIGLILKHIRNQLTLLIEKIEETEKAIEK